MSLAFRIVGVQVVLGALAAFVAWLATGPTGSGWQEAGSLLLGSLCIALPSLGYAWLVRTEHRPERMLGLAWVKIVATVLLLTVAAALLAPEPLWLVAGVAVAYVGHGLGSFFLE